MSPFIGSSPVSGLTAAAQAPGASPRYLLVVLALIYTSSWVDRSIINILAQPIKEDLALTDTELGVLGGIAFAALYSVLGIPAARLAERFNRVSIISAALVVWTAMTMLCAAAANFVQLALARAGVGIGEAACTPCAHSLIADSFPAKQRATAMSVYSLGVPLGVLAGSLGGAWMADLYGWRAAFVAVSAPGLLLALIAKLTIPEPQRGRFDPPSASTPPTFLQVLAHLWQRRTFRHLAAGMTTSTMISGGIGAFLAAFLLRGDFSVDLRNVALLSSLFAGATFVGTLSGGYMADRLAKRRDARMYLLLPAIAYVLAAGLFAFAILQGSLVVMTVLLILGHVCYSIYLGPSFGVLHNMVGPRMRATAVAILFVLVSLVGLGVGPVLVGSISDFAAAQLANAPGLLDCGAAADRCGDVASFEGLRVALVITAVLFLWPAAHYLLASRTVARDLIVDVHAH